MEDITLYCAQDPGDVLEVSDEADHVGVSARQLDFGEASTAGVILAPESAKALHGYLGRWLHARAIPVDDHPGVALACEPYTPPDPHISDEEREALVGALPRLRNDAIGRVGRFEDPSHPMHVHDWILSYLGGS